MGESNRDHSSEMEARLDEKHLRWLRPKEICDLLRDPNNLISEKPAITPPSGYIVLYDRKLLKHFRKDGYEWKKTKDGKRTKEAHEKLKVEGVDVVDCYYAHREDDEKFHRRIYWMIDKNLSHRVLVHYRDLKEDQTRTGKGVLPSSKTDASAYDHQASSGLPLVSGLQHDIACSSSNPSNFQHSQDVTNLNSAQTSEPVTTISAYNHQASFGLPHVPGLQYEIASSIFNPSDFQPSQATDAINFQNFGDPNNLESFENVLVGLPEEDTETSFHSLCSPNSSNFGDNEQTLVFGMRLRPTVGLMCLPAPTRKTAQMLRWSRVIHLLEKGNASLNSFLAEGDDLFLDSTKSKATPLATIEGVDEEEERNDTYQPRKRLKVFCGQKSIATSTATNITAAPESSSPAVLQSRPTSDANQDFVQDVESHEFSQGAVMDDCKSLRELFDRASASNTLASSSISTPATDSLAIATIRTFLEMNFTTMAGDVKRTDKISLIKRFVDSNCFPTDSRTSIWQILERLEEPLQAYSKYDMGKNLNAQVEDMIKRLQPKVEFCDSKRRELQRLENEKMQIEADQAVIRAEIDGAVKETEPIQAELKELLPQRDHFNENEVNLKISLVVGDGYWNILKKVILGKLGSSYSDIHDQEVLDSLSGVNA